MLWFLTICGVLVASYVETTVFQATMLGGFDESTDVIEESHSS